MKCGGLFLTCSAICRQAANHIAVSSVIQKTYLTFTKNRCLRKATGGQKAFLNHITSGINADNCQNTTESFSRSRPPSHPMVRHFRAIPQQVEQERGRQPGEGALISFQYLTT